MSSAMKFTPDTGMDDCPNCGSVMQSAQHRVKARCGECDFRSYLINPVGWVRYLTDDEK